jgi:VWFA-related protein
MNRKLIAGAALLCCGTIAWKVAAQQSAAPPVDAPSDSPIKTTVSVVQAPTTVTDRSGALVDGLRPDQFRLFDNGKEQDIHVDIALQPLSLVVAVQCTDTTEAVLKQIQRAGSLLGPQVVGESGEAAVLAFDSRVREIQAFTNDGAKITEAVHKIHPGGSQNRMIDAVDRATFMLRGRPASRRRIILLISETHDVSSEARLKETLIGAQLQNVTIYSVNISHFITSLTGKPQPPRPNAQPATAYSTPGGQQPSAPTTNEHKTGLGERVELVPLGKEIYKDVKGIFVDNTSTLFTQQTGGTEYSFMRQRGLEDAIEAISREIHSQYMISYNPNNKTEGGFHEIEVRLDRPEYTARTRPGYFLASLTR